MDNTLFSSEFGIWIHTSNKAKNIPSELSAVIDAAQDPSLNEDARKSCRDYAVIKHKQELFDIINTFKKESETITYSTYMRNHFRHGNWDDIFVNITKGESATLLGSLNRGKWLFIDAWFSPEDVDKVLAPRLEFDPNIIYKIGIIISERDWTPQLYLCPYEDSIPTTKLTPTVIYPSWVTLEKWITIIKRAYEYMNRGDADTFDIKMLIKEPKREDSK